MKRVFSWIFDYFEGVPKYFDISFTFYIFIPFLSLYPHHILQWVIWVLKGPLGPKNPYKTLKSATFDEIIFNIYIVEMCIIQQNLCFYM